jgi:hypothetical protein
VPVYKTSNSGLSTRREYTSFLAGNEKFIPNFTAGAYDSIASTTVGSGGVANVTFSSIPSTYTHLQLRYTIRNEAASDTVLLNFNNDSTNANYAKHQLRGSGSASSAVGQASVVPELPTAPYLGITANVYNATVVDILDYANTNKNTTLRSLGGYDANGSGWIWLTSGLWMNTAAVSTIKIYAESGDIAEYSSFALYGIKGV